MAYYCHKCQTEVSVLSGVQVGRRDVCPKCNADLHTCVNCRHHDRASYNECSEPQADRVLEKEASNYCDYFEFRGGKPENRKAVDKSAILKNLDSLFK